MIHFTEQFAEKEVTLRLDQSRAEDAPREPLIVDFESDESGWTAVFPIVSKRVEGSA